RIRADGFEPRRDDPAQSERSAARCQ
ncbi:MAG: hypothetical protein ACI9TI_001853, partial [Natronomonas sp.]